MKLKITKENGNFRVSLDGEPPAVLGTAARREVPLFPGQTAQVRASLFCTGPDSYRISVGVTAVRNGQTRERGEQRHLFRDHPLPNQALTETFPISRWVREISDEMKKIPLVEEWEIEF